MTSAILDTPLSESDFALRPDDTVESSYKHLNRRRRIRLHPAITVVFEDRHTLWFRIQELIRFAHHSRNTGLKKQFDWYQGLIPGRGRLIAAVSVSLRDPQAEECCEALIDAELVLRSDVGHEVRGHFLLERKSDRHLGHVFWAEFIFEEAERDALHEPFIGWELALESDRIECPPVRLSERMIESLSADVE